MDIVTHLYLGTSGAIHVIETQVVHLCMYLSIEPQQVYFATNGCRRKRYFISVLMYKDGYISLTFNYHDLTLCPLIYRSQQ